MDKLSKAIEVLKDAIRYSEKKMSEVCVKLDFEDADVILELLKEKQPIKPEIFGNNCWCGKCDDYIMTAKQTRTPMNRSKIKFCCHCGQAIDWQEFEQDGEQE